MSTLLTSDPVTETAPAAVVPAVAEPVKAADATDPAKVVAAEPVKATDPAKVEEAAKPVVPAVPVVRAPEKYELKAAEGVKPEAIAQVEALARKFDLPQDQAQALLEHQQATIAAHVESQVAELTKLSNDWHDQVTNDPVLGGANLTKTTTDARKFLQRFGDQELNEALHKTGYTNFPPLVRALAKAGAAMGEDGIVRGTAASPEKSLGEIFYPNMKKT